MRVGLRPLLIRMVWPATIPGTVVYEFEADHGVYWTCDLRSLHWLMRIGGAVR
jgi:hypothetical protein